MHCHRFVLLVLLSLGSVHAAPVEVEKRQLIHPSPPSGELPAVGMPSLFDVVRFGLLPLAWAAFPLVMGYTIEEAFRRPLEQERVAASPEDHQKHERVAKGSQSVEPSKKHRGTTGNGNKNTGSKGPAHHESPDGDGKKDGKQKRDLSQSEVHADGTVNTGSNPPALNLIPAPSAPQAAQESAPPITVIDLQSKAPVTEEQLEQLRQLTPEQLEEIADYMKLYQQQKERTLDIYKPQVPQSTYEADVKALEDQSDDGPVVDPMVASVITAAGTIGLCYALMTFFGDGDDSYKDLAGEDLSKLIQMLS